eukprot:Rhum_TRINITY_DN15028_c10_g1::Rhum_TRINITY_DN15028_c10_g1_i1::g.134182::m.134182
MHLLCAGSAHCVLLRVSAAAPRWRHMPPLSRRRREQLLPRLCLVGWRRRRPVARPVAVKGKRALCRVQLLLQHVASLSREAKLVLQGAALRLPVRPRGCQLLLRVLLRLGGCKRRQLLALGACLQRRHLRLKRLRARPLVAQLTRQVLHLVRHDRVQTPDARQQPQRVRVAPLCAAQQELRAVLRRSRCDHVADACQLCDDALHAFRQLRKLARFQRRRRRLCQRILQRVEEGLCRQHRRCNVGKLAAQRLADEVEVLRKAQKRRPRVVSGRSRAASDLLQLVQRRQHGAFHLVHLHLVCAVRVARRRHVLRLRHELLTLVRRHLARTGTGAAERRRGVPGRPLARVLRRPALRRRVVLLLPQRFVAAAAAAASAAAAATAAAFLRVARGTACAPQVLSAAARSQTLAQRLKGRFEEAGRRRNRKRLALHVGGKRDVGLGRHVLQTRRRVVEVVEPRRRLRHEELQAALDRLQAADDRRRVAVGPRRRAAAGTPPALAAGLAADVEQHVGADALERYHLCADAAEELLLELRALRLVLQLVDAAAQRLAFLAHGEVRLVRAHGRHLLEAAVGVLVVVAAVRRAPLVAPAVLVVDHLLRVRDEHLRRLQLAPRGLRRLLRLADRRTHLVDVLPQSLGALLQLQVLPDQLRLLRRRRRAHLDEVPHLAVHLVRGRRGVGGAAAGRVEAAAATRHDRVDAREGLRSLGRLVYQAPLVLHALPGLPEEGLDLRAPPPQTVHVHHTAVLLLLLLLSPVRRRAAPPL